MNYLIHTGHGVPATDQNCRYSRGKWKKSIVIMKFTFFFLFVSLQAWAVATAQNVSIQVRDAKFSDVLIEIRQQCGYGYVMKGADLKIAKPVTLNLKSASIETSVQSLFDGQPFEYRLDHDTKLILIRRKGSTSQPAKTQKTSLILSPPDGKQTTLTGFVKDKDGNPLPGATVMLKGSSFGGITGADGSFVVPNAPENGILIVTMIGRETKEVLYRNFKVPEIILREVDNELTEVQVIAYGQVQKKFTTSNINTIKGEDIARQPVTNPLLALQGRTPGLFISQTTGQTAGNVNVVVQGRNSIMQGSDPFYVIDGIPYTPQFTNNSLLGTNILGAGGSTFNFINPADIESVTILKDADATAIYGSRAANGAILITTKKGRAGQTKVDLNMQQGWGKITKRADVLNTPQYLEMRKEAYTNDGLAIPTTATPPSSSNFDLTIWDQNKNTDWQEELIGGTAQLTTAQVSVSGGTERTQFLAGSGYTRQTTVYPNPLADIKYNVHLNMNHKSDNNKFSFMINANYLQDRNRLNNDDLTSQAVKLAPNFPNLYNADGTLNWAPYPNNPNVYSIQNPLASTLNEYSATTDNLMGNALLGYEFLPGLSFKSTFGYNKLSAEERVLNPIEAQRPDIQNRQGAARFLNKSISSYIIEPQITYAKTTDAGVFDLLLGATFQETKTNIVGYDAFGFSNDSQLGNIGAATSVVPTPNNLKAQYKYSAVFGRFNYRLKDKYIVNVTARRDGSSRFGSENMFHNFYSVGGAWLFSEEKFFKGAAPFLSFGKLRVNYGTTGNDQIGDYAYATLFETISVGMPYQGVVGVIPQRHSNPNLQWEETKKLNVGLDLGFLNNRINFSGNYFRNRSSNQLIEYQEPGMTGFPTVTMNFPATVQNTGFELLLDIEPLKQTELNWRVSINATIPRNKLAEYEGLATSSYANQYILGEPVNIVRLYQWAGLDAQTGTYVFRAADGNLVNIPNFETDQTAFVNPNPKWYGGVSNTLSYHGFQLDFLLQYVNQLGTGNRFITNGFGFMNQNAPVYVFERRWRQKGDETDVEKFSTRTSVPGSFARSSTGRWTDASFLRLKNVSLSYSLPNHLLNQAGIKAARIFLLGQNLLTFTDYEGSDPETKVFGKLPPLRMYTAGLQVTF